LQINEELNDPSVWMMFWWFIHVCISMFHRRLAPMLIPVQFVLTCINQEMYCQFLHASMSLCLSLHSISINCWCLLLFFPVLSVLMRAQCVFCSHFFHRSCIEPWLLEHRTCPMCKCDILKALGVEVSFHTRTVCRPRHRFKSTFMN